MGRRSKQYEIDVHNIALKAIEEYYGSVQLGFQQLLGSNEPALVRFCWEHGVGKPTERIDMNVDQDIKTLQIIQIPDNGRDNYIEPLEPLDETTDTIE